MVSIDRFGEAAILVTFADVPSLAANGRVHALAASLQRRHLPAVRALIPAYASLLVDFDPLHEAAPGLEAIVRAAIDNASDEARAPDRRRLVPVVYGGDFGPDLDDVAARTGLSPEEVVARHTGQDLAVYMLGFAPGHPYLGDLPPDLELPRRTTPRVEVPRGAVGIAGRQSVVYPQATPGGWHILGRTPISLFKSDRNPPTYFAAGDRVRFFPIDAEAWERYSGPPADW